LLIPVAAEVPVVAPVITHVKTVTPQLSVVVGFVVAILLEQVPAVTVFAMFAGHVMVGIVMSRVFTLKTQLVVLPLASVAVMVTGVVAAPVKTVPEAGD
jgi:multidrug transporter EmrE-like cation transporter